MQTWIKIVVLFVVMIALHEVTHSEIARIYGCKDIKYTIFPFSVHADCEQNDSLLLAQSINDIVGYNIMTFLLLIVCLKIKEEEE